MAGLLSFLKGSSEPERQMPGCANYDHHHGGCLFASMCKVKQGQRCAYFEQAVLPTAGQLKAGHKIIDEYQRTCGMKSPLSINITKSRFCECGNSIPPNRRYCDTCKRKRRQKTYREYMRKYRLSGCNTVIENLPL